VVGLIRRPDLPEIESLFRIGLLVLALVFLFIAVRGLLLLTGTTAVVVVRIVYVDRPLARFFNAHMAGTTLARAARDVEPPI